MSFTALQGCNTFVRPSKGLTRARSSARTVMPVRAAASAPVQEGLKDPEALGFKMMRKGIKQGAEETILTPRFYTTDFDEMERLFATELNPNLDAEEIASSLNEFRQDYNQTHFVRNESFKKAAENITGPARKIFIEFLERSCTAEFSGFLLYKELARRLQKHNPDVAEIFNLLSRDEARHAGFLNKAMADFGLQLDLGFLTKNRSYTFFKPQFIILATYLSEKIGYWRYITIYRHLQRNPDKVCYPLFEYFENWCQDENRHGDFLAAVLKAKPEMLSGWQNALWTRFFCLSVYITMYINDNQRSAFYELLGMNTRDFDQHVIIETNKTAERCFLETPDVEAPGFWDKMDDLITINNALIAVDNNSMPDWVKKLQKLPLYERMGAKLLNIYFMPTIKRGTVDLNPEAFTAMQF